MPYSRSTLVALTLSSFLACPILAQTAASPETEAPVTTLKMNVRTVLVDVVAVDKENRAVPGLTKEDFQVLEDGKPQTISAFDAESASAPEGVDAPLPPPLPPNTFTNVPSVAPNNSVNVLLMDGLNTTVGDQAYVHKEMVRYLTTLPPRIRIAIFLLSERLRIIQGFTQDSTVLRAAIARLAANPTSSPLLPTIAGDNANQAATNMILEAAAAGGYGGVPNASLTAMADALQKFLGQEAGFENNNRLLMTLESLQQIASYLSGIPGRKNLIWFVGSFPHCLVAAMTSGSALTNSGCPYEEKFKKTVDMLAAARVSIYPVDAKGLIPQNLNTAENPKMQGEPTSFQGIIKSQENSLNSDFQANALNSIDMDQIAQNTGGRAFYNNNSFQNALTADIANGSRYYTLAYTPTNRSEVGKERKIEIKTVSGSYKLAYRRSYYEDTPKQTKAAEAAPSGDPLRQLMDRGMPNFTQLRYRLTVDPAAPQPAADALRAGDNADLKAPFTRYSVNFALATDGLVLVPGPDGVRRGNVEVALVAYDQGGKPLNWEVRSIGLAIRPEQNAMAESVGILFHLNFDAPSGEVYLRSGVYDAASSRAGTLEIPLKSILVARR